ncbi:carbohydrate esterase family 4 protein [Daedalea quercina L-15889]|uniref:chitin deacetylase n=1 Tax=Daedalea quercina L-15889 TaxID=1314783 RepID=A0A165UHA1_9APHY|nr:carbohydrate esterase family 4 protein [Daedalea quercina L-15889]
MRFALVSALALPLLASAHGPAGLQHHHVRDTTTASAAASSASASGSGTSSAASSAASGSAAASSVATGTAVASGASSSGFGTITFTLASTNPTAIPYSSITYGAATQTTHAMSVTYTAGSKPTDIPNAPPIPNWASLNPKNYPTLDKTPPTDSDEVKQWIQEVANSGVPIPDFAPTNPGGCSNNTEAAKNATLCWWTCGGCDRDYDVSACPTKDNWGLTYDDGPSDYTTDLLAYLDQQDIRGTFFAVGSRVISRPALAQAEYIKGHQVAVHTWSHPYMTTKTNEEVIAELGWSRKVIKDTLGVTPIYWRPPYGDIDDRVRAIGMAMNLYPVMWTRISSTQTFDTLDYDLAGGQANPVQVLDSWDSIMNNSTQIDTGFIVLEHDLFQQTVDIAVGYILPEALAHKPAYNITPVITCLGMPMANAYMETNDNSTNKLPARE